jgi:hypothetical protein
LWQRGAHADVSGLAPNSGPFGRSVCFKWND